MIPGRASAAFIPNRPNRDASALSLFLIHPFKPFSSLGDGSLPPPDAVAVPPPPGNNASYATHRYVKTQSTKSIFTQYIC